MQAVQPAGRTSAGQLSLGLVSQQATPFKLCENEGVWLARLGLVLTVQNVDQKKINKSSNSNPSKLDLVRKTP